MSLNRLGRALFATCAGFISLMSTGSVKAHEPTATLTHIDSRAWAEVTMQAFRTIGEPELVATRQQLLSAIQSAHQVLDTMPAGGVLRRETELAQLQSDLNSDMRDLIAYRKNYRLIARKMPKEAEAVLDEVRKRLWKYMGQLEWSTVADQRVLFEQSVNQIQDALSAGAIGPENIQTVSQSYAWLAKSGWVNQQLTLAAERLSHPNEYIRMHSSFVKTLLPTSISKSIPFEQKMDKVKIKGRADVDLSVGVEFVPNNTHGEFRIRLEGTGSIPITASIDQADVHAKSNMQMVGKLGVNVKSRGLELGQDDVCVQNVLTLQKVCLHLRSQFLSKALTPLASRILKRLLPKADEKIEETIKTEIKKQLNDSGFAAIVQLNSILNQVLWETVDARDVDTQSVVWTTAEEFHWRDKAILPSTLGAPTLPPGFGSIDPPLQFQLHESALNNSSVVLCRRRYNEVLFRELVYDTLGLRPISDFDTQGGKIPAAFTFADEDPLQAKFQDNSVEFQIRIQKFEWENITYSGVERLATVKYLIIHQGNQIRLEQLGETQLEPAEVDNPVLQQVLSRFFVRQAEIGRSTPSAEQDKKISLEHVSLANGWLQVGIDNASPSAVSAY